MIKAVCFDFFGVVCSDGYWKFTGSQKNTNSAFAEYADEVNSGELHWQDFVSKVANASGKTTQEVNEMYKAEQINPQIVGYIESLRSKYKTALITNAHHEFIDTLINKTHLEQVFDVISISSRLKTIKPEPKIFEITLQKLEVQPQEAVFVDDLDRHVRGAEAVGMHAILYKNFTQMRAELEALL